MSHPLPLEQSVQPIRNLVKNPSPQVNSTGFSASGEFSTARTSGLGVNGYGFQAIINSDSTNTASGIEVGSSTTNSIAVSAGETITPSVWVSHVNATHTYSLRVSFWDEAGTQVGSTTEVATQSITALTRYRLVGTPQRVPQNAVRMTMRVVNANAATDPWRTQKANYVPSPSNDTVRSGTTTFRTNICTNPSFEANTTTGWSTNATLAAQSAEKYSGTYTAQLTATAAAHAAYFSFPSVIGASYTVSVWLKTSIQINLQIRNSASAALTASPTTSYTEWTRVSVTAVANSTESSLYIRANAAGIIYFDNALIEQTEQTRPYFDGATPDAFGWDYGWSGTANNSTSTAKCGVLTTRTNYCINPSFEVDLLNWSPTSGTIPSVTRDTSIAHSGSASMKIVTTGTNGEGRGTSTIAITSGTRMTCSIWIYTTAPTHLVVLIENYEANTYVSAVSGATLSTTTSGEGWQRFSVTGITAASGIRFNVRVPSAVVATWWMDDALVEDSPVLGTYFDGSTPANSDFLPAWSGTAHASTSIIQAVAHATRRGLNTVLSNAWISWEQARDGATSVKAYSIQGTTADITLYYPFTDYLISGGAIPLAASTTYTWRVWVYLPSTLSAANNIQLYVQHTSASVNRGAVSTTVRDAWQQLTLTFTTEATGTVYLRIRSAVGSSLPAGATLWIDQESLIQADANTAAGVPFFDGNTVEEGRTISWTGTPGASTSLRSGDAITIDRASTAPGEYQDGATPGWRWTGASYASPSVGYPYTLESIVGSPLVFRNTNGFTDVSLEEMPGTAARTAYIITDRGQINTAAGATGAFADLVADNVNQTGILRQSNSNGRYEFRPQFTGGGGTGAAYAMGQAFPVQSVGRHVISIALSQGLSSVAFHADARSDVTRSDMNGGSGWLSPRLGIYKNIAAPYESAVAGYLFKGEHSRQQRVAVHEWLANKYGFGLSS